jgi:hypothetical protein
MKAMIAEVWGRFVWMLASPHLPMNLALLAILLTLPALWGGFQFDDYLLEQSARESPNAISSINTMFIFMDGNVQQAQSKMEAGIYPWFALPEGKVAFWRPLSALTHWVDFRIFPNLPALMHMQNIVWFAFSVFLTTLLYREFLSAPAAGLAAILFAVDDAHGYAVGWIANRNALMAYTFGLLALLLYHRFIKNADFRKWFLLLGSAACFLLAILSAEAGVAAAGYLIAYVLFLRKPSKWICLTLTPHLLVLIGWAYFYRLGGYGGWGTSYIDPARESIPFLAAVIERAPILSLGLFLYPPAEIYPFVTNVWIKFLWAGTGVGLFIFLGKIFYPTIRQNKNYQFLLAGAGLSILLNCSSLPANRLLLFAGLGGFAVLAAFLTEAKKHIWAKRLFLCVHLFLAAMMLPITAISSRSFGGIEPAILSAPIKPTVIIISAPSAFHADFFHLIRARYGSETPDRVWYLGAGLSPMTVYRPSERSLVIRADDGYISGFDSVFRGIDHPLTKGEIVNLNGLHITVQEVTSDGRPAVVMFEFSDPLQDHEYQWLIWKSNRLVEWQVPEIGGNVDIR